MKVALISMPFITCVISSSALSLFKSLLKKQNIDSDVIYLNTEFYNLINNAYIQEFVFNNAYAGDWMASRSVFGTIDDEKYFHLCQNNTRTQLLMINARLAFEQYLDKIWQDPKWEQYDIFAFTTNLGQTVASLSLAKKLKQRFPNKITCIGGYGVFKEIGLEIIKHCNWIDWIFWGNSDHSFPEAAKKYSIERDSDQAMSGITGCAYRSSNGQIQSNMIDNIVDHNDIPEPDLSDFVNCPVSSTYLQHGFKSKWSNIEFSRGCYYGESVVCTFCSEPGLKMKTIPKTFKNAIQYLKNMEQMYPDIDHYIVTDPLLPQGYIENVFGEWAKIKTRDLKFFIELKPYITPKQMKILKDAGVILIQPGIESFHPEILKLTQKGHKVHHGISFLNFCKFFGIGTTWNYLILVPKEKPEWAEEQLRIMKNIVHLDPPANTSKIHITKYTPYIEQPDFWELKNLVPSKLYATIYPDYFDFDKLAWFYDNDFLCGNESQKIVDFTRYWRDNHYKYRLEFTGPNVIFDNRFGEDYYHELSDLEVKILKSCFYPVSTSALERKFPRSQNEIKALEYKNLLFVMEGRCVSYVSVSKDYEMADISDKQLVQLGISI